MPGRAEKRCGSSNARRRLRDKARPVFCAQCRLRSKWSKKFNRSACWGFTGECINFSPPMRSAWTPGSSHSKKSSAVQSRRSTRWSMETAVGTFQVKCVCCALSMRLPQANASRADCARRQFGQNVAGQALRRMHRVNPNSVIGNGQIHWRANQVRNFWPDLRRRSFLQSMRRRRNQFQNVGPRRRKRRFAGNT